MSRFWFLPMLGLCLGCVSASAQTPPDMSAQSETGGMTVTPQIWCHVADLGGRRVFVSEPSPLSGKGRLGVWNAGAEFLNAVNARFMLTMRGSDHACGTYASRTAVLKAQGEITSAASRNGVKVIAVGGY